jgi:uncharacterized protein involved in type VI secretion and phage assembly
VAGRADIQPMQVLQLGGIGHRFNGRTWVSGVRHRVDSNGWITDIQFGFSPEWYCRRERITAPPAGGLLPPVSGLQIGIVDQFAEDPAKEFRVKVILPAVDEKEGAVWARLALPDGGKGRGYCFRPEPGDEVVIGFFNNDPRQPVILGGLHSSFNPPPERLGQPTKENEQKAIVTRGGTTIGFKDGEKPSFFIESSKKNRMVFDDEKERLEISDQHENKITLDKDGITIKSAKDLKIEASGNVEIKGTKVDVK